MEYFLITQNPSIRNLPNPRELAKLVLSPVFKKTDQQPLDDLALYCKLTENHPLAYVDFIANPAPLVSDKLKAILEQYEANIFFKPVYLIQLAKKINKAYWYIAPPEIDCLSTESEFTPNKLLKKMVLDEMKIGTAPIFQIAKIIEKHLIIRLDVAESLLRREATGIRLERVRLTAKPNAVDHDIKEPLNYGTNPQS